MADAPRPNAHLDGIPRYQPGRSAEAAMAEHGLASAVKLASNEAPFGALPGVPEAVAAALADVHRYPDHGATAVAEAFAARTGVPRERVAVGPGSVGLLEQLALAYAGPGDEVLFPWPSFIAYPQFTQLAGATAVNTAPKRQSFDVDALLASVTDRTRMACIANPNNPVPTALRTDDLVRLVDGLPEHVLVVVDEAYREYVTGADVPDALELFRDRPNVVVLRTMSKAYGLAALRVGFLVGDPSVVAAVDAVLIPFAVNLAAQAAALAAFGAEGEMRERADRIANERDRVAQTLRHRGFGLPESQGNFVWLPAGDRSLALAAALERQGVVTRGFPTGVRVTTGLPHENDRFLAAFTTVTDADPTLAADWRLPTGDLARRAATLLDDLLPRARSDRGADRLAALVAERSAAEWDQEPVTPTAG